jgi:hypothetical protein
LLGIKARLRYRRPSQLQHKGPHAAQEAPLSLSRHHGRRIAGPHPDPNEIEREVSAVGAVRLIVRGSDGFPVEIVLLGGGLFEVE